MAGKKDDNKNTNGHGTRVKFRLVDFEMQGGTAELVEGFKHLATALTRGTAVTGPARTLPAAPKPTAATTAVIDDPVAEEVAPAEDVETESTDGVVTEPTDSTDKPKRKYVPKAPQFLSSLDLTTGTTVSLEDFVQQKSPGNLVDKYTVIAEWLKEQKQIEEITADHIFTAFKALKWQMPDDPVQPLREAKSTKHYFDKGEGKGGYKINWNGTNAVAKMGASE